MTSDICTLMTSMYVEYDFYVCRICTLNDFYVCRMCRIMTSMYVTTDPLNKSNYTRKKLKPIRRFSQYCSFIGG